MTDQSFEKSTIQEEYFAHLSQYKKKYLGKL